MSPELRFHHIGVACRAIDAEVASLAELGYWPEGNVFCDPIQKIRGRFLVLGGGGPRLELLEPLGEGSPLQPWLDKGVKLYHQAFEVDLLGDAVDHLRARRAKLILGPVPAVAFGDRQIAFLMLPNMLLVELIQAPTGVARAQAQQPRQPEQTEQAEQIQQTQQERRP